MPKHLSLEKRNALWGYALLSPSLIGIAFFILLPLIASLYFTFTDWDGIGSIKWQGFANYVRLNGDPLFRQVMWNTAYFTVLGMLGLIPSLLLAFILNTGIKGKLFFRTNFFIPYVSMSVAVAMLWKWIYDSEIGILNYFLEELGLRGLAWLGDTRLAMPSVVIVHIWKNLGYTMLLFLAGLQNISKVYYEAAEVDGANEWRKFLHITLPLLSPTIFFVIVVGIIGSFQVFDLVYMMTQGGPVRATNTIVYYIYTTAFQDFQMGYGCTLAWVLFVIILAVTLVQFQLQKKWVHYE